MDLSDLKTTRTTFIYTDSMAVKKYNISIKTWDSFKKLGKNMFVVYADKDVAILMSYEDGSFDFSFMSLNYEPDLEYYTDSGSGFQPIAKRVGGFDVGSKVDYKGQEFLYIGDYDYNILGSNLNRPILFDVKKFYRKITNAGMLNSLKRASKGSIELDYLGDQMVEAANECAVKIYTPPKKTNIFELEPPQTASVQKRIDMNVVDALSSSASDGKIENYWTSSPSVLNLNSNFSVAAILELLFLHALASIRTGFDVVDKYWRINGSYLFAATQCSFPDAMSQIGSINPIFIYNTIALPNPKEPANSFNYTFVNRTVLSYATYAYLKGALVSKKLTPEEQDRKIFAQYMIAARDVITHADNDSYPYLYGYTGKEKKILFQSRPNFFREIYKINPARNINSFGAQSGFLLGDKNASGMVIVPKRGNWELMTVAAKVLLDKDGNVKEWHPEMYMGAGYEHKKKADEKIGYVVYSLRIQDDKKQSKERYRQAQFKVTGMYQEDAIAQKKPNKTSVERFFVLSESKLKSLLKRAEDVTYIDDLIDPIEWNLTTHLAQETDILPINHNALESPRGSQSEPSTSVRALSIINPNDPLGQYNVGMIRQWVASKKNKEAGQSGSVTNKSIDRLLDKLLPYVDTDNLAEVNEKEPEIGNLIGKLLKSTVKLGVEAGALKVDQESVGAEEAIIMKVCNPTEIFQNALWQKGRVERDSTHINYTAILNFLSYTEIVPAQLYGYYLQPDAQCPTSQILAVMALGSSSRDVKKLWDTIYIHDEHLLDELKIVKHINDTFSKSTGIRGLVDEQLIPAAKNINQEAINFFDKLFNSRPLGSPEIVEWEQPSDTYTIRGIYNYVTRKFEVNFQDYLLHVKVGGIFRVEDEDGALDEEKSVLGGFIEEITIVQGAYFLSRRYDVESISRNLSVLKETAKSLIHNAVFDPAERSLKHIVYNGQFQPTQEDYSRYRVHVVKDILDVRYVTNYQPNVTINYPVYLTPFYHPKKTQDSYFISKPPNLLGEDKYVKNYRLSLNSLDSNYFSTFIDVKKNEIMLSIPPYEEVSAYKLLASELKVNGVSFHSYRILERDFKIRFNFKGMSAGIAFKLSTPQIAEADNHPDVIEMNKEIANTVARAFEAFLGDIRNSFDTGLAAFLPDVKALMALSSLFEVLEYHKKIGSDAEDVQKDMRVQNYLNALPANQYMAFTKQAHENLQSTGFFNDLANLQYNLAPNSDLKYKWAILDFTFFIHDFGYIGYYSEQLEAINAYKYNFCYKPHEIEKMAKDLSYERSRNTLTGISPYPEHYGLDEKSMMDHVMSSRLRNTFIQSSMKLLQQKVRSDKATTYLGGGANAKRNPKYTRYGNEEVPDLVANFDEDGSMLSQFDPKHYDDAERYKEGVLTDLYNNGWLYFLIVHPKRFFETYNPIIEELIETIPQLKEIYEGANPLRVMRKLYGFEDVNQKAKFVTKKTLIEEPVISSIDLDLEQELESITEDIDNLLDFDLDDIDFD